MRERRRARLSELAQKLGILSPLAVLARGYAVAYKEGARAPLLEAAAVAIGQRIRIRLHKGELVADVRHGGMVPDDGPLFRQGGDS